jgi:protein TonB
MFTETLLESGVHSGAHRRRWTTLTSLLMQCALLGILVVAPMIYTEALSVHYKPHELASPSVSPPPSELPRQTKTASADQPRLATPTTVVQPGRRYNFHTIGTEEPAPAPVCCVTLPGSGSAVRIADLMPPGSGPRLLVNHPLPRPVVTSRLMEGHLIRRVQPVYPTVAKLARVQGTVVLHAIIGKDGHIENMQVVSGPALLAGVAVDAVKQWEYRPYVLNGQAVEVETQITVNFRIGG